ncbi:ADP-ribosyltransferase [Bacillus cereus]|uniref:ADP ribosyltransferase domain-containing protein n=1 Tax=Bacillus cereus TaxID=1396 RepID=A0A2B9DSH8_BACCE|nr:ADP-ribosyltransferase [Bacillus cereus]PGM91495.1 hypothetical protein CN958_18175 [Bacillus cereus]
MKTKNIIRFTLSVLCISTVFFMNKPDIVSSAPINHPLTDSRIDFKEDRERAHEWGSASYGTWLRGLTLTEHRAIDKYSGGDYRNINNYLRFHEGNLGADGVLDPTIQQIDKALKRAKTPGTLTVYRRVGETAFGLEANSLRVGGTIDPEKAKEFAETFINKTRKEHAYISTSLVKQPVNVFPILLHITVPKGSHGAYIESISQKPEEMELLLARGYSYQIDGISIVNEQGRESLKVSAKLIKE